MTQFHEGQDVEVYELVEDRFCWRFSTVTRSYECEECGEMVRVKFPDGSTDEFPVERVRVAT